MDYLKATPRHLPGVNAEGAAVQYVGNVATLPFLPFCYRVNKQIYLIYTIGGECTAHLLNLLLPFFVMLNAYSGGRVKVAIFARRFELNVALMLEQYEVGAYLYLPRDTAYTITRLPKTGLQTPPLLE